MGALEIIIIVVFSLFMVMMELGEIRRCLARVCLNQQKQTDLLEQMEKNLARMQMDMRNSAQSVSSINTHMLTGERQKLRAKPVSFDERT